MFTPSFIVHHTRRLRLLVVVTLLALSVLHLGTVGADHGGTMHVDTTADDLTFGNCSLREAIIAANTNVQVDRCPAGHATSPDTIVVPPGIYTIGIAGVNENAAATGDLDITGNLILNGAGTAQTTFNGAGLDRVLHVLPGATTQITDLTITNGLTPLIGQDSDHGGGIFNQGALTLSNSRVINNATQAGAEGTYNGGIGGANDGTNGGNGGHGGGIYNDGTLTLTGSTVGNNAAGNGGDDEIADINEQGGSGGSGGGIFNQGTMTIANSAITGNTTGEYGYGGVRGQDSGPSGRGGGISNAGTLTVTNSTVSGNRTPFGGGIYEEPDNGGDGGGISTSGNLTLTSVTVTRNVSGWYGGGIHNVNVGSATTIIRSSILAENYVNACNSSCEELNECAGTLTSHGYNIVLAVESCTLIGDTARDRLDVNPRLGQLQDNGGPTFTHALLAASPAIDSGTTTYCTPTDQRGVARQDGNGDGVVACDIGAYEYTLVTVPTQAATSTVTATPTSTSIATATSTATTGPTVTGTRTIIPTATGTRTIVPTITSTHSATTQATTIPLSQGVYLPFLMNGTRASP